MLYLAKSCLSAASAKMWLPSSNFTKQLRQYYFSESVSVSRGESLHNGDSFIFN